MQLLNNCLSFLGNISSIIGLCITIAVWFGIKSLKSFYVAKATIPHQLSELALMRENIDNLLSGEFDKANKDKVIEYSSTAYVNIQNLMPKLKGMDKKQFSEQIKPNAMNFINTHQTFTTKPSKENARAMNTRLFEFLRSTELVIKDEDWRYTK
jgi:hypothetical protein